MNVIKNLRKAQTPKMSQEKLGKLIGVGRTTVAMWESGSSEPDNATLVKLAEIFGVSTDYLLGVTVKKQQPLIDVDEELLDKRLIDRLTSLSQEEQGKVDAFVQGMIASRPDKPSLPE